MVRVSVLTVSDMGAAGDRADGSGDAVCAWAEQTGHTLVQRAIVPDETDLIASHLIQWADSGLVDVIITTGGTGFGPRDVTPEATMAVLDRHAPGIAEAIRADARPHFPRAVLSRGIAGSRGETLIVNLPGSPGGVRDGLSTLTPLLEHVVLLLTSRPTDH